MTTEWHEASATSERGRASSYAPARLRDRIAARCIDATFLGLVMWFPFWLLILAVLANTEPPTWVDAAGMGLVALPFAYELAFTKHHGRTLGKRAFRLAVLDVRTGQGLPWWRAVIRLLPLFSLVAVISQMHRIQPGSPADYIVPLLPLVTPASLVPARWSKSKRGLHDFLAGTIVIQAPRRATWQFVGPPPEPRS